MATREELQLEIAGANQLKEVYGAAMAQAKERAVSAADGIRKYTDIISAGVTETNSAEDLKQFAYQLETLKMNQKAFEDDYQTAARNYFEQDTKIANATHQLEQADTPTDTVKTPEAVNAPAADTATTGKYENATIVSTMPDPVSSDSSTDSQTPARDISVGDFLDSKPISSAFSPRTPPNSEPKTVAPAYPTVNEKVDRRVRIKVPSAYLVGQATGPNGEITRNGGIVFPYTPTVSASHSANYTTVSASHTNYNQYFYKNSSVSDISISGKFSVQNETEAGILLGTIHLLRALTKMKFGDDQNAGSPPPVCRLFAFGTYMFDNTPVAVKEFRIDLPADVDYIDAGKIAKLYGNSMVPTMSTISVTLVPLYSRQEMLSGTVSGWLTKDQRSKGYL